MVEPLLSDTEIAARRERRKSFMGLLTIEANPLTNDKVAIFDIFDRERWSDNRCRQYLLHRLRKPS